MALLLGMQNTYFTLDFDDEVWKRIDAINLVSGENPPAPPERSSIAGAS
jgi:hypothetical protein